jgi:sigma-B regulation protein RsbU (phosphoserine phosphatase)
VNHFVQPSSEIGGDLWGISPIDDHRIAVYMFDIAGHGVSAAINAFRIHSLLNLHTLRVNSPALFLDKLNKRLCNLFQPGQYATIFLGVLDTASNVLTFAAAASPQPLIMQCDGKSIWLDNEGYPLGVISTADFPEQAVKLLPGDTLFLYSDALIESPCAETNAFLSERDIELALHSELAGKQATANIHTEKQIRFMLEMMKKLGVRTGTPLRDDLTMTLITRLVASDPA